jgi:GcrA cell cycle regulator
MPNAAWTAEDITLLKRLWAEGETAAAIAARLGGISRSAVLGKVYRLRLGAGGGVSAATAPKKVATDEAGASLARRRKGGKRKQQLQVPPIASRRGKTLLELTNDTCRC